MNAVEVYRDYRDARPSAQQWLDLPEDEREAWRIAVEKAEDRFYRRNANRGHEW